MPLNGFTGDYGRSFSLRRDVFAGEQAAYQAQLEAQRLAERAGLVVPEPPVGGSVYAPPSGSAAFADFAKDRYFLGTSIALQSEILVGDAVNWGVWTPEANIQTGIGLIYNEVTDGWPIFAPGLATALTAGDGFTLIFYCSLTNLQEPPNAPPVYPPIEGNNAPRVGCRTYTADVQSFEHFGATWQVIDITEPNFGGHGQLSAISNDEFNAVKFSGSAAPFHTLLDTFKVGLTMIPSGSITVVADRFDPVVATGNATNHAWTGVVLEVLDSNLENPSRVIVEQLTVYVPPLSDADLFTEVQLVGPHLG